MHLNSVVMPFISLWWHIGKDMVLLLRKHINACYVEQVHVSRVAEATPKYGEIA